MPASYVMRSIGRRPSVTSEQKAFVEYGRSRGWLKAHRSKRYFVDVPDMGLYVWHVERNMHGLDALIRDAWKKRAACRVWVPLEKRECRTCSYLEEEDGSEICENCMIFNSLASSCNWEPRKEGE